MTTFLLIRHAHCDPVGHAIAGRAKGVHLNDRGRTEAKALGARLAELAIDAVYSSPLERALETATEVADRHGLPVKAVAGLNEVDFGEWTGRTLVDLDSSPEWRSFNSFRSGARIPGGESMTEVLARALTELGHLRRTHGKSGQLVAVVSHGDVLRAVIAHYLGAPTDLFQRIEVSPASVSILTVEPHGPRLLLLNSLPEWPAGLLGQMQR
jgi:probable phosphoglycerate mutase